MYAKGVKSLKNYWSAWLTSTHYKLGDIGILNGHYFAKVGSLDELKVPFQVPEDSGESLHCSMRSLSIGRIIKSTKIADRIQVHHDTW